MFRHPTYIPLSCLHTHSVCRLSEVFEGSCVLPLVEACEMADGGVSCRCLVVCKGDVWGQQSARLRELFTASKAKGGRSAHVFTVHAHVCSTGPSCFLMGPRWLIYPILSYPIEMPVSLFTVIIL